MVMMDDLEKASDVSWAVTAGLPSSSKREG